MAEPVCHWIHARAMRRMVEMSVDVRQCLRKCLIWPLPWMVASHFLWSKEEGISGFPGKPAFGDEGRCRQGLHLPQFCVGEEALR